MARYSGPIDEVAILIVATDGKEAFRRTESAYVCLSESRLQRCFCGLFARDLGRLSRAEIVAAPVAINAAVTPIPRTVGPRVNDSSRARALYPIRGKLVLANRVPVTTKPKFVETLAKRLWLSLPLDTSSPTLFAVA